MRAMHLMTFTAGAVLLAALSPQSVSAATATRSVFGQLQDGTKIDMVKLRNGHGVVARIMTLGADLQSLDVPDRNGRSANVVLGYANPAKYLAHPNYFGATVGRYANRIADAQFTLDRKTYHLEKNDGPNSLHGGFHGFDKQVWTITSVKSGEDASVTMELKSPNGADGFPGNLTVTATYSLQSDNVLNLTYRATTDRPTVLNITNHSFWNLRGEATAHDILDEILTIDANAFTPVDRTLIPTGEIRPVAGTPYDFRHGRVIGADIHDGHSRQLLLCKGYDENFVLNGKMGHMHPAARLVDPVSGRVMELSTNQPGLQLYSGNFLDGSVAGTSGHIYRQSDGVAMEPQHFPNSPNEPKFPTTRLNPGQTYISRIQYRFSTTLKHADLNTHGQ